MRHSGGVGITDLLKDGSKHFSGVDEAVLKNIEACKKLSMITRTSIGPNGMNKMVVNHLGKLLVTNDAATIVKEMEVRFFLEWTCAVCWSKEIDEGNVRLFTLLPS